MPEDVQRAPTFAEGGTLHAQNQLHPAAVDAKRMLSIVGNDTLTPIAADVRQRLAAVVERTVR